MDGEISHEVEGSKPMRVVIVDDYKMTRTLLKIILRGEQFDIVGEAIDGESGVKMCDRLKPDLVFLDIIMPGMNGLEALEKIMAVANPPMVLMVTSVDEHAMVDQALKLGASGFIVKPFNTASIIESLREARDKFVVRDSASVQRIP